MAAAPDLYRYISLEDAARRIGGRRADARDYLQRAGVVRRVNGRRVVWLAALVELDDNHPPDPVMVVTPAPTSLPSDDDLEL